ncbi:MAG TPA: RdgB/HAM1 family non-canonical purine NTP pyrophosphatase [Actinocrinis sp.]|nr:RdgB/HAM1 family non-canonical purine NTP pyrophosphatase [Actinocrinis sp.]HZP51606.1 RdgB/HAM1 family non-canonical purine NTP pyrophosphatase [Actinocrinis sp.]
MTGPDPVADSSPVSPPGAARPRVVLATRNRHKIDELHAILAATGVEVELLGVGDFADLPDVRETGVTFAENALLKAVDVAGRTGLPAIADDSGLCVDVLGGAPGIFSARWAGKHGDDKANLDLLLAQLADVADSHRQAHFACAAALALPGGGQVVREGRIDGTLLHAPRGTNGFGYDPIFRPDGYDRTTAEMPAEEKNAISHRTRAFQALAKDLATLL